MEGKRRQEARKNCLMNAAMSPHSREIVPKLFLSSAGKHRAWLQAERFALAIGEEEMEH
jgi:hypothetical protein